MARIGPSRQCRAQLAQWYEAQGYDATAAAECVTEAIPALRVMTRIARRLVLLEITTQETEREVSLKVPDNPPIGDVVGGYDVEHAPAALAEER